MLRGIDRGSKKKERKTSFKDVIDEANKSFVLSIHKQKSHQRVCHLFDLKVVVMVSMGITKKSCTIRTTCSSTQIPATAKINPT